MDNERDNATDDDDGDDSREEVEEMKKFTYIEKKMCAVLVRRSQTRSGRRKGSEAVAVTPMVSSTRSRSRVVDSVMSATWCICTILNVSFIIIIFFGHFPVY